MDIRYQKSLSFQVAIYGNMMSAIFVKIIAVNRFTRSGNFKLNGMVTPKRIAILNAIFWQVFAENFYFLRSHTTK